MLRTIQIAIMGLLAFAIACSDTSEPIQHAEEASWEPVLVEEEEVPTQLEEDGVWEIGEFGNMGDVGQADDEPSEEFWVVSEFAGALSADYDDGAVFEQLFEVADRSSPLTVFVELPMFGKETPIISGAFDDLEHFARCLHGEIEPMLCGSSEELERLIVDTTGVVEEELRSCVNRCCNFDYRHPPEDKLTIRYLCYEEITDGRLVINELTLGAE